MLKNVAIALFPNNSNRRKSNFFPCTQEHYTKAKLRKNKPKAIPKKTKEYVACYHCTPPYGRAILSINKKKG